MSVIFIRISTYKSQNSKLYSIFILESPYFFILLCGIMILDILLLLRRELLYLSLDAKMFSKAQFQKTFQAFIGTCYVS